MRNANSFAVLLGATIAASMQQEALAQIRDRCKEDQLTTAEQGRGRNAWAHRCGYLKSSPETFNAEGLYIVFTSGNQPFAPDAPCEADAPIIQGFCPIGCYHPHVSLRFGDVEREISTAAGEERLVTSLAPDASQERLSFRLQPIESFTVGRTRKPLYWLRTQGGHSLGVTHDHPIVLESGVVVPARELTLSDVLFTQDGPSRLISVEVLSYEGEVWNVEPRSRDKIANIHVANGILTGSIRFQNQWANQAFRIWERSTIDITGL